MVLGVEGDHGLVERAKQNAALNNINNVEFRTIDLVKDNLIVIERINEVSVYLQH